MKKTKKLLTDAAYASLKSEGKERRIPDVPMLYMRIQVSGQKSWQMRIKNSQGKWTWYGLGNYPKVSVAEARLKAAEIVAGKIQPVTRKDKVSKLQEEKSELFEDLMWEWVDTKKNIWTPETFHKEVQSIKKHLLPVFGKRKFKDIKTTEWHAFFQKKQRVEKIFNRIEKLLGYVDNAYDYAVYQDRMQRNPVATMKKYLDKGESHNMKHVHIRELPEMIRRIKSYSRRDTGIGLQLLILMFPRPGELRKAKWEQFDFEKKVWLRPKSIMKRRKAHAIPLSPQVIKLLNELKEISKRESDYLFPSRDSVNKPISEGTFTSALNRLGYRGKQNPHGFRHIASTNLNKKFSSKDQVIEAALSHIKGGSKGPYDKTSHYQERIGMMNWWGKYIDSMIE